MIGIESIFNKIIASFLYDKMKNSGSNTNETSNKEFIDQYSQELLPAISSAIDEETINSLSPYLNDELFNSYLIAYCTDIGKIKELSEYFNDKNLTQSQLNEVIKSVNSIRDGFEKIILDNAQNPKNTPMVTASVNTIIPNQINRLQSQIDSNRLGGKNQILLAQLEALLKHEESIFEKEKVLYGEQGVNKRLITEIARLQIELEKIA